MEVVDVQLCHWWNLGEESPSAPPLHDLFISLRIMSWVSKLKGSKVLLCEEEGEEEEAFFRTAHQAVQPNEDENRSPNKNASSEAPILQVHCCNSNPQCWSKSRRILSCSIRLHSVLLLLAASHFHDFDGLGFTTYSAIHLQGGYKMLLAQLQQHLCSQKGKISQTDSLHHKM